MPETTSLLLHRQSWWWWALWRECLGCCLLQQQLEVASGHMYMYQKLCSLHRC